LKRKKKGEDSFHLCSFRGGRGERVLFPFRKKKKGNSAQGGPVKSGGGGGEKRGIIIGNRGKKDTSLSTFNGRKEREGAIPIFRTCWEERKRERRCPRGRKGLTLIKEGGKSRSSPPPARGKGGRGEELLEREAVFIYRKGKKKEGSSN